MSCLRPASGVLRPLVWWTTEVAERKAQRWYQPDLSANYIKGLRKFPKSDVIAVDVFHPNSLHALLENSRPFGQTFCVVLADDFVFQQWGLNPQPG